MFAAARSTGRASAAGARSFEGALRVGAMHFAICIHVSATYASASVAPPHPLLAPSLPLPSLTPGPALMIDTAVEVSGMERVRPRVQGVQALTQRRCWGSQAGGRAEAALPEAVRSDTPATFLPGLLAMALNHFSAQLHPLPTTVYRYWYPYRLAASLLVPFSARLSAVWSLVPHA